MNRLKILLINFSIPICVLATICVKVFYAIKNQTNLLTQYDLYLLFLILIISSIFSYKKENINQE